MEPVTHILTGACLSRAGLNRRAAYATLTMAIAAEFPDIDTLWSLRGPIAGFQHHRGITHTFVGLPVRSRHRGRRRLHPAPHFLQTGQPRPPSSQIPNRHRPRLCAGACCTVLRSSRCSATSCSTTATTTASAPFSLSTLSGMQARSCFIFDPLIFNSAGDGFPDASAVRSGELRGRRPPPALSRTRLGDRLAGLHRPRLGSARHRADARAILLASAQSVAVSQPDTASETAPCPPSIRSLCESSRTPTRSTPSAGTSCFGLRRLPTSSPT